jgi:anti-anti-sigma factor
MTRHDNGPEHLELTVQRTGTTVRIIASGELDLATVSQLREHTSRQLGDSAEIVVLDLTAISFIDSSGLHALIEAAAQAPGRLRILPSPECQRLFDITGVGDRLPLIDRLG